MKQKIENKLNLFFKQKVPVIETIIILKRRFKQKIENTEEKQFIFGRLNSKVQNDDIKFNASNRIRSSLKVENNPSALVILFILHL